MPPVAFPLPKHLLSVPPLGLVLRSQGYCQRRFHMRGALPAASGFVLALWQTLCKCCSLLRGSQRIWYSSSCCPSVLTLSAADWTSFSVPEVAHCLRLIPDRQMGRCRACVPSVRCFAASSSTSPLSVSSEMSVCPHSARCLAGRTTCTLIGWARQAARPALSRSIACMPFRPFKLDLDYKPGWACFLRGFGCRNDRAPNTAPLSGTFLMYLRFLGPETLLVDHESVVVASWCLHLQE